MEFSVITEAGIAFDSMLAFRFKPKGTQDSSANSDTVLSIKRLIHEFTAGCIEAPSVYFLALTGT